jgi:hypothetical protein
MIIIIDHFRQVNGFLRVLQFSPPIKLTDILLKEALNNLIFSHCGGRRENFWGISFEKSRFCAKKSYFKPNSPERTTQTTVNLTLQNEQHKQQ